MRWNPELATERSKKKRSKKDLDISRQTYIVMVKREGKALVPNGSLILRKGDVIILYTKEHLANEEVLSI